MATDEEAVNQRQNERRLRSFCLTEFSKVANLEWNHSWSREIKARYLEYRSQEDLANDHLAKIQTALADAADAVEAAGFKVAWWNELASQVFTDRALAPETLALDTDDPFGVCRFNKLQKILGANLEHLHRSSNPRRKISKLGSYIVLQCVLAASEMATSLAAELAAALRAIAIDDANSNAEVIPGIEGAVISDIMVPKTRHTAIIGILCGDMPNTKEMRQPDADVRELIKAQETRVGKVLDRILPAADAAMRRMRAATDPSTRRLAIEMSTLGLAFPEPVGLERVKRARPRRARRTKTKT